MTFYVKNQCRYFLLLQLVFVMPLVLFLKYSPYPLPNIEYVVMACLFASQYVVMTQKKFDYRYEGLAKAQLNKQTGKVPSKSKVIERLSDMREARTFMIGLSLVILWVITILNF
jgi:hypothetical protein